MNIKSEKYIERLLTRIVRENKGTCIKLDPTFYKGLPDRLVIFPNGIIYFIELKGENGILSKSQSKMIEKLNYLGCKSLVLSSVTDVKEFTAKAIKESRLKRPKK